MKLINGRIKLISKMNSTNVMGRKFHVIIEKESDGTGYFGRVPELKGCLSQGDTIEELLENIKEAIELVLEVQEKDAPLSESTFVDVQEVEV